jgi:Uma2 family endonuclease
MVHRTTRPPKTIEDYLALPDDVRAELIAGELYVTPAPRPDHQRAVLRLGLALAPHVESEGLGEVFLSPVDVHLPSGEVVEPDVVFIAAAQKDIVRTDAIHGAPRLLVEVLSPSHPERDRIVKMDLYARNDVFEYWIVDPAERSVEVFQLDAGRYRPAGWFTSMAQIVSPTLTDLAVPVAEFFA